MYKRFNMIYKINNYKNLHFLCFVILKIFQFIIFLIFPCVLKSFCDFVLVSSHVPSSQFLLVCKKRIFDIVYIV